MATLRFCMLTTFYPPWGFGGDAIQVRRLAHALADRGHEVTVVHSLEGYRAMARGAPVEATATSHPSIRLVSIDAGMGALSPLATYLTGRPLLVRRPLERVLDERFDVVHFHNPSLLGGPALMSLGTGLKLYTLHEQWLICPTHVLWKNRREVCRRPQCVRCQLIHRRPPQPWRHTGLLNRSVAGLDGLIAPSRTSARLHREIAGDVPVEHVPHFLPDPGPGAPHLHGRPYFLYAGRLEAIKGPATAIAAFARRPEALLVAGSGSLEGELSRQAAGHPNVELLGWRSESELAALYRGALAVVVPTVGHESFGLVAVEAFAHGTPAIVPRFGALGELAADSRAALTYDSPAQLDAAIDRLASEPQLRRDLGREGRRAYLEHWTDQRHLDRYFEVIARLARRRGDESLARRASAARSKAT